MCDLTFKQPVTDCNALFTNSAENVNKPTAVNTGVNNAKMREALEDAEKTLSDSSRSLYGIPPHLHKLLARIRDALAAPARNCDVYKTLDDARNAFFADYVPDETCSSATAFAIWLFDEAKGETK